MYKQGGEMYIFVFQIAIMIVCVCTHAQCLQYAVG
jgi:hypothetical protein